MFQVMSIFPDITVVLGEGGLWHIPANRKPCPSAPFVLGIPAFTLFLGQIQPEHSLCRVLFLVFFEELPFGFLKTICMCFPNK